MTYNYQWQDHQDENGPSGYCLFEEQVLNDLQADRGVDQPVEDKDRPDTLTRQYNDSLFKTDHRPTDHWQHDYREWADDVKEVQRGEKQA